MSDNPWFRIGWRNLGRHRKRTVLTALGLAVGYFAAVFTIGYSEGLMAEMVENATGLVSGQIEIHDAEYRPERSLYDTIGGRDGVNITRLLDGVSTDPGVVAVAPRVYAGGLVSSGESTSAGMLMGIDPERELTVSRFLDELVEGRVPEQGRNELAIGVEMARQLAVGVGDDVIIVAPGADGSMGNDLYAVSGIFRTGMPELDASNAVLPLADLQTLITLDPSNDPKPVDRERHGRAACHDTKSRRSRPRSGSLDRTESHYCGVRRSRRRRLWHRLRHRLRRRHLWRRQHDADVDVRTAPRDRGHARDGRQAGLSREDGPLRSWGNGPTRAGPRSRDQSAADALVEHRPDRPESTLRRSDNTGSITAAGAPC